uniref:FAD-binding PCMH-type domain-containing protein n=1 Tax=Chromera velia CCMP2878 TaxID=1169474 RepID=A0A0G4IGB2_9ALVE|eukprot:Cvel_137.t1-p1 / transcript=Cvel_137.t1 / gene=Cvel_137 / organism=Chromera_velia_CCMP2878 / gene_product=hypothetical protein / transcript_product=hypothetical protein / location=Cvel_scaffold9:210481-214710(+) / protein_length=831 / sequence_SO=supercontig / SO=protein_coding / is_pseudo=false
MVWIIGALVMLALPVRAANRKTDNENDVPLLKGMEDFNLKGIPELGFDTALKDLKGLFDNGLDTKFFMDSQEVLSEDFLSEMKGPATRGKLNLGSLSSLKLFEDSNSTFQDPFPKFSRPQIVFDKGDQDKKKSQGKPGPAFPKVVEANGSPVPAFKKAEFINWGGTVENKPFATFYPTTRVGVQNAVRWAVGQRRRVRCSMYKHTWESGYSQNEGVLISLLPEKVANTLPSVFLPLDESNEFQFIQPDGEAFEEGGKLKRLFRIGAGVTNEQFREWVVDNWRQKRDAGEPLTDLWTLPWNVILVENTLAGTVSNMCHGAGIASTTLSDLVTKMEVVNAKGDIQTINDPEQLSAAAGAFGLAGVIISLTFKLDALTYADWTPQKKDLAYTIPPPGFDPERVPESLRKEGVPDVQRMRDAFRDFVWRVENDYYSEFFWYPYQKETWVNRWNNTGDGKIAESYPGDKLTAFQNIELHTARFVTDNVQLVQDYPRVAAQAIATYAQGLSPTKPVVTPLIDAIHFRRGIHNLPVYNMEWELRVPAAQDGSSDWTLAQESWWAVIDLLYSDKWRKRAPMMTALEMRVYGNSERVMAPNRENDRGTVSIEILTLPVTSLTEWLEFMQDVTDMWLGIEDFRGQLVTARPHWAKMWSGLNVRGIPVREWLADEAYLEEIAEFKELLGQVAGNAGVSLSKQRAVFSNPQWDSIIFREEGPTAASLQRIIEVENRTPVVLRFVVNYQTGGGPGTAGSTPGSAESNFIRPNFDLSVAVPADAGIATIEIEAEQRVINPPDPFSSFAFVVIFREEVRPVDPKTIFTVVQGGPGAEFEVETRVSD